MLATTTEPPRNATPATAGDDAEAIDSRHRGPGRSRHAPAGPDLAKTQLKRMMPAVVPCGNVVLASSLLTEFGLAAPENDEVAVDVLLLMFCVAAPP